MADTLTWIYLCSSLRYAVAERPNRVPLPPHQMPPHERRHRDRLGDFATGRIALNDGHSTTYRSSPGATTRRLYPTYGAQITFAGAASANKTDVNIAALGDRSAYTAIRHNWFEIRIPWLQFNDDLHVNPGAYHGKTVITVYYRVAGR